MRVAILGTVGVPGAYGGFETLAENLVTYHDINEHEFDLSVYCSSKGIVGRLDQYRNASLRYINLDANGIQSIPYDILGIIDAIFRGCRRLLLLGVSGAIALPLLRLVPGVKIITNVDGIEWKREKWQGVARHYLRFAEWVAVKCSHVVVADNQSIADYLRKKYGCDANVIPYGGDHAVEAKPNLSAVAHLPERYALGLCRIEPENNIGMILEAFEALDLPLVFVGNWDKSDYGRRLKTQYLNHPTITIHDSVYDPNSLRAIRDRATLYVHGHSAGGTNPALVEMMHFGIPIAAHGCSFNRYTTEGKALYFESADELRSVVYEYTLESYARVGSSMAKIARRRYTWDAVGKAYFALLEN